MIKPFSKKQKQILSWWMEGSPVADKDILIAEGSIRSGKTLAAIDSFIMWSQATHKNQNFIIAGKTVGALQRNVLQVLFDLLNRKQIKYSYRLVENKITIGTNTYYCFGANTEKSQDLVQGLTAAGFFADEVTLMPRSFVEQAMGRCSVDGAKYFFTLNPSNPRHWFKEEFIDKLEQKNALHLHLTMDDNPGLTPETKERLKRMFTGVFYKRYIEGLWVQAEGLIYDMFDEKLHVIDCPQDTGFYDKLIVAIDYGTASVMTWALYGIKGESIYLIREYYWDAKVKQSQKTDAEYARDLKAFLDGIRVDKIYIDPSATSFRTALRKEGYRCIEGAKNEVINGIRTVATKLHQGKFFIDRSCKDTIREFGQYVWDVRAQELGEDRPVKKDDHAMDRNRYAIHSFFSRPSTKAINKPKGW